MKVSVEAAQENLEQLIERAFKGEEILIYLNERDAVELEPIDQSREDEKQSAS